MHVVCVCLPACLVCVLPLGAACAPQPLPPPTPVLRPGAAARPGPRPPVRVSFCRAFHSSGPCSWACAPRPALHCTIINGRLGPRAALPVHHILCLFNSFLPYQTNFIRRTPFHWPRRIFSEGFNEGNSVSQLTCLSAFFGRVGTLWPFLFPDCVPNPHLSHPTPGAGCAPRALPLPLLRLAPEITDGAPWYEVCGPRPAARPCVLARSACLCLLKHTPLVLTLLV